MKIHTDQTPSFVDALINYPESNMDPLALIPSLFPLKDLPAVTETDYAPESLLRVLLLREFYNMSYEVIASLLKRDLISMKFSGFSVSGPKPDATTPGRFRDRMIRNGSWDKCPAVVNAGLEEAGLKIKSGVYVSDATLIPSTRKKPKGRPLSPMNKRRNRIISKRRFVAERTFGTMKRVYGMTGAKLIGLEKATSEVLSKSIAYNLRRASKSVIPDTIMAYAG